MSNNIMTFHPDILEKFDLYTRHSTEKNRITNQFLSILKSLCDLSEFYSRNLEKLADSTSKLIVGKDALKQVFIIFERILSSKSQQAMKMAEDIKNDMMPYVRTVLSQQNYTFKKMDKKIKEVKAEMQKKYKNLEVYKNSYSKAYQQLSKNFTTSPPQMRQQLKSNYKVRQNQLVDYIKTYNSAVEAYLLTLSQLTNLFSASEGQRKKKIKSSIHKFIIFQISAIKNIEYNIDRYCKALQAMEDKLTIFDKMNDSKQKIHIAKVSANNFLEYVKFDILEVQKTNKKNILNIKQLKEKFIGQIDQNQYKIILKKIYTLLDHINQTKDIQSFQKLLQYGEQVFKLLPQLQSQQKKIYLTQGIFCHHIFKQKDFWDNYFKKLVQLMQKQTGSMSALEYNAIQSSFQQELHFLKKLRIDNNIIRQFRVRLQGQMKKRNLKQIVQEHEMNNNNKKQKQVENGSVKVQEQVIKQNEVIESNTFTNQQYEAFS